MRDIHVTAEGLDRFARGDLDDRELSEVLDHLEACETCARTGQVSVANDLAALRSGWTAEPDVAWRRPVVWMLAAAAAIAIAVLSLLLMPRDRPSVREPARAGVTPPARPIVAAEPPRTNVVSKPRVSEPRLSEPRYERPEWQRLVERALADGRLSFPVDLAALSAPSDTVRGSAGSVDDVSPSAMVVEESRPAFRWPVREGGTYTVFVFDGEREVTQSAPLNVPRWTPGRDLPRGRTLTWQVEVAGRETFETIPSPPSPPATFRIMSETHHRDLQRAREMHRNDDLLFAVLYARSGMRGEALAALRRAAAENDQVKRILDHETSVTH